MSISQAEGRYYVRYQGKVASDLSLAVAIELAVSSSQGRQPVFS